jgi:hypothetical protein
MTELDQKGWGDRFNWKIGEKVESKTINIGFSLPKFKKLEKVKRTKEELIAKKREVLLG